MHPLDGRRVVLGVTGGIAAYKAAWLARLLVTSGAELDVVLTPGAARFIAPLTFAGLTGRPVHEDLFDPARPLDHIRLAQQADAVVVAPATADFLARSAQGRADDLLAALLLATRAPVLLVPAMNDAMWAHPQTVRNVAHLRALGYTVLEPETGPLAAGEGSGPGRLPEPETVLAHVERAVGGGEWRQRRVIVTAGPTREPLDPVRFLSNRSSGRMGVALAAAAWRRGATVTLVAGPLEVAPPVGVDVVRVETTADMAAAVRDGLPHADVLIMAAAPADFAPAAASPQKIPKGGAPEAIPLAPTPDILAETRPCRRPGAVIVGFALETDDVLARARQKLAAKDLDLIVVNDAGEPGAGFGVETNRVTVLGRDSSAEVLPLMPKTELAGVLLDRIHGLLRAR